MGEIAARVSEERAQALLQAGLELTSALDLDSVLQRIIEVATKLTDARYGALGVLGQDLRIVEFVTTGMDPHVRAGIGDLPIGRGILRALIDEARTLRIPDISQDPRSFGFPPNHPPMKSFLGAPVTARGRVFGNIYLTEKRAADEFTEEDERTIEILAAQAGVAIENARLYDEAVNRERRLEAMGEVAVATLEGQPLEEVLSLLTLRALDLLHADVGNVVVPSPDHPDHLMVLVAEGKGAEGLRGAVFPIDGSISGQVVLSGRALAIATPPPTSTASQPIVAERRGGPGAVRAARDPARSDRLAHRGQRRWAGGRSPTTTSATLATFAAQASIAVEYDVSGRELERLAVARGPGAHRQGAPRRRHPGAVRGRDGTAGRGRAQPATRSWNGASRRAVAEIDGAIRDLRNYIFGLRPGILADRQLDQALRTLGGGVRGANRRHDRRRRRPPRGAELASKAADVVQLAREALSNVGRHAEAATVRLSLSARDGRAVLEIDDDGRGFDPGEAADRGGHGLRQPRRTGGVARGEPRHRELPRDGTTVRVTHPAVAHAGPYCTIRAVAMPNIPFGPSTWDRMWQWNAHTPGCLHARSRRTARPGAITSVSAW